MPKKNFTIGKLIEFNPDDFWVVSAWAEHAGIKVGDIGIIVEYGQYGPESHVFWYRLEKVLLIENEFIKLVKEE